MKPTQRVRMRELFESKPNVWIPLPEIAELRIMQYGRVISEIRHGLRDKLHPDFWLEKPMDIQNMTRFVGGITCSWFKWIKP